MSPWATYPPAAPSSTPSTSERGVRLPGCLCCLLAWETCGCHDFRGTRSGGMVVLEVTMRGGKRSGGSLVSMVLTSRVQRCCAPERNGRISTIPAGRFDGRLGNVSAVDTGPLRVSPGLLPQSPAPPSQVLLHRSLADVCAGAQWSWLDAGPAPSRLESACSTRVGIHWPRVVSTARRPHLPEAPQPSSSSAPPSCSAPRRRRQPPQ